MTLNLTSLSPWPNRLHHHNRILTTCPTVFRAKNNNNNIFKASLSESYHEEALVAADDNDNTSTTSTSTSSSSGDDEYELIIERVSSAKDASEALQVFGEMSNKKFGVVSSSDCCRVISAAIQRNNADLALSIFNAMRSSFGIGVHC
ncbi:putative tetratricopeptide-like helical domain superfamily protein [Tanacetum coccineum]